MLWVTVWVALVVCAVLVLGLLARSVFGTAKRLFSELGAASERLGGQVGQLSAAAPGQRPEDGGVPAEQLPLRPDEPAVFADPAALRAARARGRKRRGRGGKAPARRMAATSRSGPVPGPDRERTTHGLPS